MDCKTFDDHLLDELYGELDEVTSAAMARHAESCSSSPSCATKLTGLRSTREALTIEMPYVPPPDDLEDRILAATRDARPVIPLRRKMSGAVSWAGAWAMRPQTAMAAVFLLMIGSSLAFLRTHRSKSESSNAVAVSELGKPELSSPAAEADVPNESAKGGASGGAAASGVAAAAPAAMPVVPMATSVALGSLDESKDDSSPRGHASPPASSALAMNGYDKVLPAPPSVKSAPGYAHGGGSSAASDPADDSRLRKEAVATRGASKPRAGRDSDGENSADLAQAGNAAPGAPPSQAAAASQAASSDDAFTRGQQAYTARRFDEARDDFDAAAGGNVAAALWAARSVRDGQGCGGAVSRFDDVVNRAPSSSVGFDARLEGARCYRALGKTDVARARLVPLLTVPSHAARAQAELATMAPPPAAAAKKAAPSSTGAP